MAVTTLGWEIPSELYPECPADAVPKVLDDISLIIERESLTDSGEVRSSTAVWVGRLRKIARAKLALWGLSALADDAQLLISELVTNGFRYGESGAIRFRLLVTPQRVVIAVNDGSGTHPQLSLADASSETGRGLYLVDALAEGWGVSPDGTTTWCTLATAGARG